MFERGVFWGSVGRMRGSRHGLLQGGRREFQGRAVIGRGKHRGVEMGNASEIWCLAFLPVARMGN